MLRKLVLLIAITVFSCAHFPSGLPGVPVGVAALPIVEEVAQLANQDNNLLFSPVAAHDDIVCVGVAVGTDGDTERFGIPYPDPGGSSTVYRGGVACRDGAGVQLWQHDFDENGVRVMGLAIWSGTVVIGVMHPGVNSLANPITGCDVVADAGGSVLVFDLSAMSCVSSFRAGGGDGGTGAPYLGIGDSPDILYVASACSPGGVAVAGGNGVTCDCPSGGGGKAVYVAELNLPYGECNWLVNMYTSNDEWFAGDSVLPPAAGDDVVYASGTLGAGAPSIFVTGVAGPIQGDEAPFISAMYRSGFTLAIDVATGSLKWLFLAQGATGNNENNGRAARHNGHIWVPFNHRTPQTTNIHTMTRTGAQVARTSCTQPAYGTDGQYAAYVFKLDLDGNCVDSFGIGSGGAGGYVMTNFLMEDWFTGASVLRWHVYANNMPSASSFDSCLVFNASPLTTGFILTIDDTTANPSCGGLVSVSSGSGLLSGFASEPHLRALVYTRVHDQADLYTVDNNGIGSVGTVNKEQAYLSIETGIRVEPGTVTVNEGSTGTFTIVLGVDPIVPVTFSPADTTEILTSPTTLIFTDSTFSIPQTVTVSYVNDDVDLASPVYTADVPGSSSSSVFPNPSASAAIVGVDNDVAALALTPATSNVLEGSNAAASLTLATEPTSSVTIQFTSATTAAPGPFTFTPTNYASAQNVDFAAPDDNIDQPTVHHLFEQVTTSNDGQYHGVSAATTIFDLGVLNDDTASIIRSSPLPASTAENGGTSTFTVLLATEPLGTIIVSLNSVGIDQSEPEFSFTPTNYNVPQTLTMTMLDDNIDDVADPDYQVEMSPDANYIAPAVYVTVTSIDDDTAEIWRTDLTSTTFSEVGGSYAQRISLATQPLQLVTVTVAADLPAEVSFVGPTTIVFSPSNYAVEQTVGFDAVDDATTTGTTLVELTMQTTSSDSLYNVLDSPSPSLDVTLSILDDDSPAVVVTTPGSVSVVEGSTGTISVALGTQPSLAVTVDVTAGSGPMTYSPTFLEFTTATWSIHQIVTFSAMENDVDLGPTPPPVVVLSSSSRSLQPAYHGLSWSPDTSVTCVDDDTADMNINATSTTISETDTPAVFTVVLAAEPTVFVTVTSVNSNPSAFTLVPAAVVFSTTNWADEQSVAVHPVDDNIDKPDATGTLVLDAQSSDPGFVAELPSRTHTVTVTNDDVAAIDATQLVLTVDEDGGAVAVVSVVLDTEPTSFVTIGFAADPTVFGPSSTVVFSSTDYTTPKTISMTPIDNSRDDVSDEVVTIAIEVASDDGPWNGLDGSISYVLVVADDDTAGFVGPTTADTSMAEASDTTIVTTSLSTEPLGLVSVSLGGGVPAGASAVSPPSVAFTSANWNTEATFTITAADDDIDQGGANRFTSLTFVVDTTEPRYSSLPAPPLAPVELIDDDEADLVLSPLSSLTISENSGTADFSLQLQTEPTSTVTVVPTPSSTLELSTSTPASFVFSPANWATVVTFTVSGVDDSQSTPPTDAVLQFGVSSDDNLYDQFDLSNTFEYTITLLDDDVPGVTQLPFGSTITIVDESADALVTVVLDTMPASSVTVEVATSDVSIMRVQNALSHELVFSPLTWDTEQTFTISAVDNAVDANGDATVTFNVVVSSADSQYDGLILPGSTAVTVREDDTASLQMLEPVSSEMDEHNGAFLAYGFHLNTKPVSPVTVSALLFDDDELAPGAPLVFSTVNYATVQTLTVSSVDDDIDLPTDPSVTFSVKTTSDDVPYNALLPVASLPIVLRDNDTAAIDIVAYPESYVLSEAGNTTMTFAFQLTSEPTATVRVRAAAILMDELESSAFSGLLFNASNWNIAQTVTLTVVDDATDDPVDPTVPVTLHPLSNDPQYAAAELVNLTFVITDDDFAGLVVNSVLGGTASLVVPEPDQVERMFLLRLVSEPVSAVTIEWGVKQGSTGGLVACPDTVFSTSNWNTDQTVTVTSVDNADFFPTFPGEKTHLVPVVTSDDQPYDALEQKDAISIQMLEDDLPPVVVQISHPVVESVVDSPRVHLPLFAIVPPPVNVTGYVLEEIKLTVTGDMNAFLEEPNMVVVGNTADLYFQGAVHLPGSAMLTVRAVYSGGYQSPPASATINIVRYPAPTVTSLVPADGPLVGNVLVTVTGSRFGRSAANLTAVTVGGLPCVEFALVSESTVTCLTPPVVYPGGADTAEVAANATGPVVVTTMAGSGVSPMPFTINDRPRVTSISPRTSLAGKPSPVTLTGPFFAAGREIVVSIANIPCVSVTYVNATTIVCQPGRSTSMVTDITGGIFVTVERYGMSLPSSLPAFTYTVTPLLSIVPASGPVFGGTQVTLTGDGILGDAAVDTFNITLAGAPCLEPVSTSPSTVVCTSSPSSTLLAVKTDCVGFSSSASGVSPCSASFAYTYPPPVISSLSVQDSDVDGGAWLNVTGESFGPNPTYLVDLSMGPIGASCAASAVWYSSTKVGCTIPSSLPGTGPVVVTTPGGTSLDLVNGTDADATMFAFIAPPEAEAYAGKYPIVESVHPPSGPVTGGYVVTLSGSDLGANGEDIVRISGCSNPVWLSSANVTCTVEPAQRVGAFYFDVETGTGGRGISLQPFYFVYPPPTVEGAFPRIGSRESATRVTLVGSFFGTSPSNSTAVTFADEPCTNVAWISETEIACTVPPFDGVFGPSTAHLGDDELPDPVPEPQSWPFLLTINFQSNANGPVDLGFRFVEDGDVCRPACALGADCIEGTCVCIPGYALAPACAQVLVDFRAPSLLVTSEDGLDADVSLVLREAPESDVIVKLAVTNEAEGKLDGDQVRFTSRNWNQPATLTISGVGDALRDGNRTHEVYVSRVESDDARFGTADPGLYGRFPVVNMDSSPKILTIEPDVLGLLGVNGTISVRDADSRFKLFLDNDPSKSVRIFERHSTGRSRATGAKVTYNVELPPADIGYHSLTIVNAGGLAAFELNVLYYTNACTKEGMFADGKRCVPCPTGGICPGGDRIWAEAGYWVEDERSGVVARCEYEHRCPGGKEATCAEAYTGEYCANCADGYYASGGGICDPCPKQGGVIGYILADVIMWTLFGMAAALVEDRELFTYCVVAVRALQTIAGIGETASSDTPAAIRQIYDTLKLFSGDYSIVKADCVTPIPYHIQFYFTVAHSILIFVPMFLILAIAKYMSRRRMRKANEPEIAIRERMNYFEDRHTRCVLVAFTLVYLILGTKSLEALMCTPTGEDLRLLAAMDTPCFQGTHLSVVVMAGIFVIGLVIGLPTGLFFWYRRNPRFLHTNERFMEKFNFFYEQLRPGFENVFLVEFYIFLSLIIGKSLLQQHPNFQNGLLSSGFFAKFCIIVAKNPYKLGSDNWLQAAISVAALFATNYNFVVSLGILTAMRGVSELLVLILFVAVGLIFLAVAAYIGVLIVREGKEIAAKKDGMEPDLGDDWMTGDADVYCYSFDTSAKCQSKSKRGAFRDILTGTSESVGKVESDLDRVVERWEDSVRGVQRERSRTLGDRIENGVGFLTDFFSRNPDSDAENEAANAEWEASVNGSPRPRSRTVSEQLENSVAFVSDLFVSPDADASSSLELFDAADGKDEDDRRLTV